MKFYVIDYIGKPKGDSGEDCGSFYDLSQSCKNCGTPAKLIDNLMTKGLSQVKNSFFATLSGDFITSKELNDFLASKCSLKLNKVLDSRKKELPYYHINPELNFPKSDSDSEGLTTDDQCPICHRNGYFPKKQMGKGNTPTIIFPLKLKYSELKEEFLMSSNFFNTWEHIGYSNLKAEGIRVIRYARPMLIISNRIKELFEEFGVKDVKYEEILIKNNHLLF